MGLVDGAQAPERAVHEAKQRLVLSHVVMIGLTPFIPLPFVDDYVKDRIRRRLVRRLAIAHGVDLPPGDVSKLADDKGGSWRGRILGLALLPVRKVFRTTFLVLGIKSIVDLVSVSWHRAFLLDHALASGWCAPHRIGDVRTAIDEVCAEVPVTPVAPALRAVFEGSKSALAGLGAVYARIFGGAADVDVAIDDAMNQGDGEAASVVERLRRGMTDIPEAHLERLRSALARRLRAESAS